MLDGGGDVFGGAVALDFAGEEEDADVGGAAGQDVEHVLDDGAGGGGDEADGGRDGPDGAFAFAGEEAFCFESAFEGFELCEEEALSSGADALDAELVGASGLVEGDGAIDLDGHAFGEGDVGAEPHATDGGVRVFEGEIGCAGLGFDAADFTADEDLSDLFFEGLEDAFVELRDGDGVAWRHWARRIGVLKGG